MSQNGIFFLNKEIFFLGCKNRVERLE